MKDVKSSEGLLLDHGEAINNYNLSSRKQEEESDEIIVSQVPESIIKTLESRVDHMCIKKDEEDGGPSCNMASVPGAVTQRSCVYGGARVVLMPITDAIHLVHGPIGCASCTWDIRGSRSSRDNLYKTGFSTNMQEKDIVFGGEGKLMDTILELNNLYQPAAIFVYSTCVVGLIGDDLKSVCRRAEEITKCRIIPVQSEGFRSFNKSLGHQLACDALLDHLIGTGHLDALKMQKRAGYENEYLHAEKTLNIVGEFNVAGDLWGIKPLIEALGIRILSTITGDSCVEEIAVAHHATLNIVQCQKSSNYLARQMKKKYDIPHIKVNFFGIEDTSKSLRAIAQFYNDSDIIKKTEELIENETGRVREEIEHFKERLQGKKVAVYVGGNKAWSLIRAFEELGMQVIMTGTQNGLPEDYHRIMETVKEGTLIVDDANSIELSRLLKKYQPDLIVSGAKEKYMTHKMGIPFCEFNHDRITSFAGFQGFINFARDVDRAVSSPVWNLTPLKYKGITNE